MDKKNKIVLSALKVFQKHGLESAKISDIVKNAGIAQGTFYLYFPSKLSVIPYIAEKVVLKMFSEIKKNADPAKSLKDELIMMADIIFKMNKKYHDVLALIYTGITQSKYMQEWESIYAPFYKWLSDFLDGYQKKGLLRASLDVSIGAKLVIGAMESAAEQVYLFDVTKEADAQAHKRELIDFICHALGDINQGGVS
ncbi:TetR family transcriptional regulator [Parelusimicrobium proximum]|uniref:TetR family transcriptional regulator n=1 Tax=Parelusimicrobium proximum TaxID=3228953 RepID=UPI003D16BCF6